MVVGGSSGVLVSQYSPKNIDKTGFLANLIPVVGVITSNLSELSGRDRISALFFHCRHCGTACVLCYVEFDIFLSFVLLPMLEVDSMRFSSLTQSRTTWRM